MKRQRNLMRDLGLSGRDTGGPAAADPACVAALVRAKLDSAETERKSLKMFKTRKIITLLAAAVAVLALSVGAYAAGSGVIANWYGGSNSTFYTLPTAVKCVRAAGYAPILLETFENGYSFSSGSLVDNTLSDDSGAAVEEFKSFDFVYEKDGDKVYVDQMRYSSDMGGADKAEATATVDGIDIRYSSYENRLVPADYELTEADREAEANGVVFSYGSDTVETIVVQSVQWEDGDLHYCVMQLGGALSETELTAMAAELIRAK